MKFAMSTSRDGDTGPMSLSQLAHRVRDYYYYSCCSYYTFRDLFNWTFFRRFFLYRSPKEEPLELLPDAFPSRHWKCYHR